MSSFIIDFVNSANDTEIAAYLADQQCSIISKFANFKQQVYLVSALVAPAKTLLVESVIDNDNTPIKLLDIVQVVQPISNGTMVVSTTDEKDWWKTYSVNNLDISGANTQISRFGNNTTTYLVDSGIELGHPEFANKQIDLLYSFTGEYSDTTGHGTSLGSVIIGNTCGMSDTKLKVVKIFDAAKATLLSDILAAIDAIITDVIASITRFSIVNLSWAVARNTYLEAKLQHLIDVGVFVVASAGNSGLLIDDVTPAAMSDVLTIGSYGINFKPSVFSDFSNSPLSTTPNAVNHGQLDSWAPGERIWSAGLNGQYVFVEGTSISAAIYSASLTNNCSQLIDLTHQVSQMMWLAGKPNFEWVTSYDRVGLLDLSDPKYVNSINKICTFTGIFKAVSSPIASKIGSNLVVRVGETKFAPIYILPFDGTITFNMPLPAFITVQGGGIVVSPIAEPTEASGVSVTNLEYTLTSSAGTFTNGGVTVVVLSSTFNVDALPPNDPLIKITLQLNCGSNISCFGACPSGFHCGYNVKSVCGCW